MGSSPVLAINSGSGNSNTFNGCCDMSLKCSCRWKWEHCLLSTSFLFFLASFIVFGSVATFYAWITFSLYDRPPLSSLGCQEDSEGSWSIGVFYGDSPFSLKPIESKNVWKDEIAAWPVANPVITCASASDSGFPSNFVADPFLYIQEDALYLFYETKNSVSLHGDIAVAKSIDKGSTWQQLGIALDEEWHLSYPYVFKYLGQIYLMPESSQKGEVRLYRAVNFPLQWTLEKAILKKPLVDSFIINYNGVFWLFGSDRSGFGTKTNGELEIWYSTSPFGPWKPHKKNPIYNTDRSFGARNGGRPFIYNGNLYRLGQDCGETYGRRIRTFKIQILTKDEYKEVEVPLGIKESKKGRNAWNGARYHHLDVQNLSSGEWIGVMDGDRVPSGDSVRRLITGFASIAVVVALIILLGVLLGPLKCIFPRSWCYHGLGKRNDASPTWERSHLYIYNRMKRISSSIKGRIKPNTCTRRLVFALVFVLGVILLCKGVKCIYGGNGADEAYPWKGYYSQFTLLTMTYEARLWNLKMYVKHYSRCSSVSEIVVVWNKGKPPELSELDSVVPIRIRVEKNNSLNNRFKVDPLIKTRAVLELDDDIMMACDDIERGFRAWREHPDRIVGFYPRLIDGNPLKYRDEKYARTHKGYNMILTGAAFIDSRVSFRKYWSEEVKGGREVVDKFFNCEDVLMNFLYMNGNTSRTVEYVKPAWAIDTSKFSGVAISRNTKVHYQIRSDCLLKFSEMYGSLSGQRWEFGNRKDGWDV